jgi:release factor glutamine methyltransferase
VGVVRFNGLKLLTSPGLVMTPRPTSEQLVAAAWAHAGDGEARVVDVGTGSGAIAIATARACPNADVWATDTSPSAVRLARANVLRHGLAGRVFVRQGDLLAPVPGPADVIVANLPYMPASSAPDRPELDAEPFDAVFANGDGLDPYRRLVDGAMTRLADGGLLLLQLNQRLVAASRSELPALAAALAVPGWRVTGAVFAEAA